MKRTIILAAAFLGFILLVYLVYTTAGRSAAQAPMPATPSATAPAPAPAPKKKEQIVGADYPWKELSRQDLAEWAALFENVKKPSGYAVNMLVDSGKSIVAEVYEAKPGEYVFTRLTPTIGRDEAGKELVYVEIDSFGITVDGELQERVNLTTTLYSGDSHQMPHIDKEGTYMVYVKPEIEAGSKVRLTSQGDYQKLRPATPEDRALAERVRAQLARQKETQQAQQKSDKPGNQ